MENQMNGKRAKLLRRLAGVNKKLDSKVDYIKVGGSTRTKEVTHPTLLCADGSPLLIGQCVTHTYELPNGARKLYKTLKRTLCKSN